jgi:alpha-D-ribose 1-methylphosphonate 5-triphosphate synthase subunit PhnH
MSAVLERIGSAMHDPVAGAQACFRVALQALARPGRIVALPPRATAGVQVPPSRNADGRAGLPMAEATAALLLTLLDAECSVRLLGSLGSDDALAWLRFHTGSRAALPGEASGLTVVRASELQAVHWHTLELGSDEAPQRGATLAIEVPWLCAPGEERCVGSGLAATTLRLRGPGVDGEQVLAVGGVDAAFWAFRQATQAAFPRGFEIVLCSGDRMAGLPRSSRIDLLES